MSTAQSRAPSDSAAACSWRSTLGQQTMKRITYLFLFLACVASVFGAPGDETEALLRYVKGLDGATFIRNGASHTPQEAEAHLRLKRDKQKAKIATAEDFIRLCATQSLVSGKPYTIRFRDGHEEAAASVLSRQLLLLREAPKKESPEAPPRAPEPPLASDKPATGSPVAPAP